MKVKQPMNYIEIRDIQDPSLKIFSEYSEVQLFRINEPDPGYFIAESANVIIRALEAGFEPVSLLLEKERIGAEGVPVLEAIERLRGQEVLNKIPIYTAEREIVSGLTGYRLVRGLWAVFKRKRATDPWEFTEGKDHLALLYDVVNPTNAGAIIRSAAALGMDGVMLTYPSVDPLTRRSARVSMGTVFQIPWVRLGKKDPYGTDLIDKFKSLGFVTIAMALTDDSVGIRDMRIRAKERIVVILGTEGTGLPEDVIKASDYRVKIPMHNGVDSLNVAAASAVCFFELL